LRLEKFGSGVVGAVDGYVNLGSGGLGEFGVLYGRGV